ncbi:MAG: glycosyltransferase, partial [Alteromonadaceae bacterium]|nr:glycosyltransferase [Alteromonadaceae bacterium]
ARAGREGAKHGVPTIGYSFGLRDSVLNSKTGLLVDDEKEFAAATRRLIADAPLRRELGEAAREFALKFSWDSTGARFEQLLRKLTQQ